MGTIFASLLELSTSRPFDWGATQFEINGSDRSRMTTATCQTTGAQSKGAFLWGDLDHDQ